MKTIIFLIIITFYLVSCSTKKSIKLSNSLDQERIDAQIIIPFEKLLQVTGSIPEGKIPMLLDKSGNSVPSQADDLDQDGTWDELALLYTFKPLESADLQIQFVDTSEVPEFKNRTNVHFGIRTDSLQEFIKVTEHTHSEEYKRVLAYQKYQIDGPGWENDKVGFRNYFDYRNGMDIWGKLTGEMVLNNVGITGENYHEIDSWGMDILKVGNSLGAGALAMYENDSLYRLTEKVKESKSFTVLCNGPVRSMFRMVYGQWEVAGKVYKLVQDITIWGGSYCYKSDLVLSGDFESKELVTGIVNLHMPDNYLPVSTIHNKVYQSLVSHGIQSENNDALGMGILYKRDDLTGLGIAPKQGIDDQVVSTFYVKLKAQNNQPLTYYFVSGWEKTNEIFAESEGFINMVQKAADEINTPILME